MKSVPQRGVNPLKSALITTLYNSNVPNPNTKSNVGVLKNKIPHIGIKKNDKMLPFRIPELNGITG